MQGTSQAYCNPNQVTSIPSWGPLAHPSWSTPPPWPFTSQYHAQTTTHSFQSYAQPQPQWNASHQGWRTQYDSLPTLLPTPPTKPQPHPHPSQIYTPTQLLIPPFPNPHIEVAQPIYNAKVQHFQTTPLTLNGIHHSSRRLLQKRDYIDIIEGPHPEKEDSKEKTKEPWVALDE